MVMITFIVLVEVTLALTIYMNTAKDMDSIQISATTDNKQTISVQESNPQIEIWQSIMIMISALLFAFGAYFGFTRGHNHYAVLAMLLAGSVLQIFTIVRGVDMADSSSSSSPAVSSSGQTKGKALMISTIILVIVQGVFASLANMGSGSSSNS